MKNIKENYETKVETLGKLAQTSNVAKVIYSIYMGEYEEIDAIISHSCCDVEISILDNDVDLLITDEDFFFCMGIDDKEYLEINDEKISIDGMSEEELKNTVFNRLSMGIKPFELEPFEVKAKKESLLNCVLSSVFTTLSACFSTYEFLLFKWGPGAALLGLGILFFGASIYYLLCYLNSKFVYDTDRVKYIHWNRKEISYAIEDVCYFEMKYASKSYRAYFFDENKNVLFFIPSTTLDLPEKKLSAILNKHHIKRLF